MTSVESKGLARAKELYQHSEKRAKELKAEGKKVMAYLCIHPGLEMLTALDIVPYRIFGDMREPITDADNFMGIIVCPFLRSSLDIGLKGRYDFIDGFLFSRTCDQGATLSHNWRVSMKPNFTYYFDTPSTVLPRSIDRHKFLLKHFQQSLEAFTGETITPAKLTHAIHLHNEQKALVRALYDLRKPDPPLISGVETLQVLRALMRIPIAEGNQLLKDVISEIKDRGEDGPPKKAARLLLWGPIIDDIAFIEMIENLGANIVIDDTCVGTRPFFTDVPITADPMDGMAHHYLTDLKCPRTYREPVFASIQNKNHLADLEYRFGYLKAFADKWNCKGIILEYMRYCDSHAFEVPGIRDYLKSVDLPNVSVEFDYSEASLAQLQTRIQGFLEIL